MLRSEGTPPARLAGAAWLVVVVFGVYAQFVVRAALIVRDDAAVTIQNILHNESFFRLGAVADLVAGLFYVVVAALMWAVLRPVSRSFALLSALFGAGGVFIGCAGAILYLAPLVLLNQADYLASLSPDAPRTLAFASIRVSAFATHIAFIYYGLHLVTMGGLIAASRFIPRVFGIALILGGLCYLSLSFTALLSPPLYQALPAALGAAAGLSELALALWLLIRGVDASHWRATAPQP